MATKSEQQKDATFAEAKGSEPNQHAKKLAKEKAKKDSEVIPSSSFYIEIGDKVQKITVKPNGTHTIYIGSLAKHKDGLLPLIAKWKKDGVYHGRMNDDSFKELVQKLRASL